MRFAAPVMMIGLLGLAVAGCEEVAATKTLEVTIEGLGPKDVEKGQLEALVSLGGSCSVGPCDPNPCIEGQQTRCLGQGTVYRCECPPGSSLDAEGQCIADEGCSPNYCGGNGVCEENEGVPSCLCSTGYVGNNCESCDNMEGFFSDGFGGCTNEFDVCRAGQGEEQFLAFLAEAEEALGHPANELELVSANISVADDSASGARNWPYLWSDDVQLVFEPTDDPRIEGGVATVPGEAKGLDPFDVSVVIDRPTFTRNPKFFEGDFSVGVTGSTERIGNEPFSLDLKVSLEFNAY